MKRSYIAALFTMMLVILTIGVAYAVVLESWDDKIAGATRWKVLVWFNNEAVLDKETQLVWEKSPDAISHDWSTARGVCADKNVGGRKGWRLPSMPELTSLIDPSVPTPGPTLPAGHPFTNVVANLGTPQGYYSATTSATDSSSAWAVSFFLGRPFTLTKSLSDPV